MRLFALALLFHLALASGPLYDNRWVVTNRMRQPDGQSHYHYSSSVDTLDRFTVVGSITENLERGVVKIYHDTGRGLLLEATLKDPQGIIHDEFGAFVKLFHQFGAYHVAVAAPGKDSDGAVFVYKERNADWELQQTLVAPTGEYVTRFGRSIHFDGTQLLISAVSRYISSKRFEVGALNVKGTRYFYEADGVGPLPTDPIYVFRSVEGRRNSTRLNLRQTLRDGPYTADFGASISVSGDKMAVGAPFRSNILYGHGTDGDLIVTGITLLDGAGEYNFNNVYVKAGGVLTVERYETLRGFGGILNLKVLNNFVVEAGGLVNLTGIGHEGAPTAFELSGNPENGKGQGGGAGAFTINKGFLSCDYDGATTTNPEILQVEQNLEQQRQANSSLAFAEACGGGGGYGTKGGDGTPVQCGTSGVGGAPHGDELVATPARGSGGGAGHPWKVGAGGGGGNGGGVIQISARVITNYGTIEANGGRAEDGGYYSGGGGGGSGGAIVLHGIELANYGRISAVGGPGGQRATGTGFGGDNSVKGGDGGAGRIRFDFLTTRSNGIVRPQPKNVTTFRGEVYLYRKSLVTGDWSLIDVVPQVPGMMFIGHSVTLDGNHLAVASDEGTDVQPIQAVYLMDIRYVQNKSSPIYTHRVFNPPHPETDRKFGYNMRLNNNTLVIGAYGSNEYPGVVYLHMGRDLFSAESTRLTELRTEKPEPGDSYGQVMAFAYPQLYLQLPELHDDDIVQTSRLNKGEIHLWKHVRNISTPDSFVQCEYVAITANTTLNCSVHTRDSYGFAVGDLIDMEYFQEPVHLDFKMIGTYSFQVRMDRVGQHEIRAVYKGRTLTSFHVSVTPAIIPERTNFTCSPTSAVAGVPIVCHLQTNGDAGEENAAAYFDVVAYNLDDTELVTTETVTSKGVFRTPKSKFIIRDPLETDFVAVRPQVTFVRRGVYTFTYTPWRPGTYAAFVTYQSQALQFPNPYIVNALDGEMSPPQTTLVCPTVAAPYRSLVCILTLKAKSGLTTGDASFLSNFSRSVTAVVQGDWGSNHTSISAVWANEGRVAILIRPPVEGKLTVRVKYGMDTVSGSPATVDVRSVYQQSCVPISRVFQSWHIMSQHTQGHADQIQYGDVATRAAIFDGKGLCDDGRV